MEAAATSASPPPPSEGEAAAVAAEQQLVGWPLPAAVVASMEWMRSVLAMPFSSSMSVSIINFKSREISRPMAKAKTEN